MAAMLAALARLESNPLELLAGGRLYVVAIGQPQPVLKRDFKIDLPPPISCRVSKANCLL